MANENGWDPRGRFPPRDKSKSYTGRTRALRDKFKVMQTTKPGETHGLPSLEELAEDKAKDLERAKRNMAEVEPIDLTKASIGDVKKKESADAPSEDKQKPSARR